MTPKKTDSSDNSNSINFEKTMTELEEIVAAMEKGSLTLEESLKHFERGMALTKTCQNALKSAEQKVQILVGDGKEGELQSYASTNDVKLNTEADFDEKDE